MGWLNKLIHKNESPANKVMELSERRALAMRVERAERRLRSIEATAALLQLEQSRRAG